MAKFQKGQLVVAHDMHLGGEQFTWKELLSEHLHELGLYFVEEALAFDMQNGEVPYSRAERYRLVPAVAVRRTGMHQSWEADPDRKAKYFPPSRMAKYNHVRHTDVPVYFLRVTDEGMKVYEPTTAGKAARHGE